MTTTPDEQPEKVGLEETVESLTGFDEIAVAQQFGKEIEDLSTFATLRAALFVLKRREGGSDREAYQDAMSASMKDVQAHFADFDPDAQDDVMPDEPESPVGKGDSQLVVTPTSSPPLS